MEPASAIEIDGIALDGMPLRGCTGGKGEFLEAGL